MRYIDATPLVADIQISINNLTKIFGRDCSVGKTLSTVIDQIDEMPTADVEPVRHGHWIFEGCSVENYRENIPYLQKKLIYKCSVCDRRISICDDFEHELYNEYPYCHCGAKMKVKEENDGKSSID